jgi:L-2-hydroxycarboxylate dehydrogenase (NAD+)
MIEDGTVHVEVNKLKAFVYDVFKDIGVPSEDASICTKVLIEADLKGFDSHGVNRLKPVYYDRVKAGLQSP